MRAIQMENYKLCVFHNRRTLAIAAGCIPIVLAGHFVSNLPETLDWLKFAVAFDMDVLFEKQEKSPKLESIWPQGEQIYARMQPGAQQVVDPF